MFSNEPLVIMDFISKQAAAVNKFTLTKLTNYFFKLKILH